MILQEKNYTYDTDTEILTLKNWESFKAPMEKWDTPEWKAILEWASKYIDILEWKNK